VGLLERQSKNEIDIETDCRIQISNRPIKNQRNQTNQLEHQHQPGKPVDEIIKLSKKNQTINQNERIPDMDSINNQSNIIQTQTNQSNDWNKSIDQIDYRKDQSQ